GLRLRQPQTDTEEVLTASAREAVAPVYRPIVQAVPLPDPGAPVVDPTCDNIQNPCQSNLTLAYSNPSSLNATSLRVDHNLSSKVTLFARYNHAPSYDAARFLEELGYNHLNADAFTVGANTLIAPTKVNDFRANWSRNTGSHSTSLTDFHGSEIPPASALFPPASPYSPKKGQALVFFSAEEVRDGTLYSNAQRQLNFVDTFSWA